MAVSLPFASDAGESTLVPADGPQAYSPAEAPKEELSAAAQQLAGSPAVGNGSVIDPAERWATETAPVLLERLAAALVACDTKVLLDYLSVELAELRRANIPEVHLIGLLDAAAVANQAGDPGTAQRIVAEGREYVRRAAARAVRSVPETGETPGPTTNGSIPAVGGASPTLAQPPGQVFADLLLLGALACQAPVALLSVPQPDGSWSTLSHGLEVRDGCNNGQLFEVLAAATDPVEIADLVASLPRSPLALPPHSMRWAYGVALRNGSGAVIGVVVVLDRWLRQLTKREQRAMASLSRQLGAHLAQWRRPDAPGVPNHSVLPMASSRPESRWDIAPPSPGGPGPSGASDLVTQRHQLLRSQEVAEIFDVTERTVINWAAAGKLPSLRTIGGHLRFRRDDVLRLLSPSTPQER